MPRTAKKASQKSKKHDAEDIELEDDGPPSIEPYKVLELERDCSSEEIKKAYRKMALKHHPDKVAAKEKDIANKKFQEIAFAYAVLSDERRRKRYDLTGSTSETLQDDDDFDWLSFFRAQFENAVSEENIERITKEYKGSTSERKDLLDAYKRHKGSFSLIYQTVMLSDVRTDDDRFRKILDKEIAKGTIPTYPRYEKDNNDKAREKVKEQERKRREKFDQNQTAEAADRKAKNKANPAKGGYEDIGGLAAMIQSRQLNRLQGMGGMLESLEAKYTKGGSKGKRPAPTDEPPEEAFAATAARKKQKSTGRPKKVVSEDEEDEEDDVDTAEEIASPPKRRGKLRRGRGQVKAEA